MPKTFSPSTCRAVIATQWDSGRKYRRRTFSTVESYFIDSAFDNDSDQWEVVLGDPDGDLMALFKRDAEVRMQLFGVGYGVEYLHTGFADEVFYTTDGIWTIRGRDMSSLAVDSIAPPRLYKHVRAANLIAAQARHLGINGHINLAKTKTYKREYTDGSETYWEFWYRLLRKDQMWLWAGSDGSLNGGPLNYNDAPTYFLGIPPSNVSHRIREKYIPIEHAEFTKDVKSRVHEVWVQGSKGDVGFIGKAKDPSTKHWIKKPLKILSDDTVHNKKAAVRQAWEEIFESKVGEREIKVEVGDTGFIIKQNRMAKLTIPGIIDKEFFVVGTKQLAGTEGYVQEIRLREKGYAASRRVPSDPKLAYPPTREQVSGVGVNLSTGAHEWGDYFVKAARKHSGPWNFNLFLACLLGICDQETGFTNERVLTGNHDHLEWFEWKAHRDFPDDPLVSHGLTYEQYKEAFANESPNRAVGPMQLYDMSFKTQADDLLKPNFRNQYKGGRWHPEWNIMIAAKALLGKLSGIPPRDENIWIGVRGYNGSGPAAEAYMRSVKHKVLVDPGYLQLVQSAMQAANQTQGQGAAGGGDQPVGSGPLGKGFPYHQNIIGYPGVGTHSFSDPPNNWQSDNAVDISCHRNSPVYAVHDGTLGRYGILPGSGVIDPDPPGNDRFGGNRVNLIGPNQSSYYAHMKNLSPRIINFGREGMRIRAGELIGFSGTANGVNHLHFAVQNGNPFHFVPGGDPRQF